MVFSFKDNNTNIDNINLEITNRTEKNINYLVSKKFLSINNSNAINLNIDLEKFSIRLGKLFIKISSDKNNLENIKDITLKLIPKYNLNNFRVLDSHEDCYFLEKVS